MYDSEPFIREAVESVLSQSVPPREVLVVDDGSTDAGAAVARSFGDPVRVISRENGGPSAARDTGIRAATGSLIAFLDADDSWLPTKLERQLDPMAGDDPPDVVMTMIEPYLDPGSAGDERAERWLTPAHVGYVWSTGLFRADCFSRFGLLAETGVTAGDAGLEWFARARDGGLRSAAVDSVLARRRVHSRSRSATGAGIDDLLDLLHDRVRGGRSR